MPRANPAQIPWEGVGQVAIYVMLPAFPPNILALSASFLHEALNVASDSFGSDCTQSLELIVFPIILNEPSMRHALSFATDGGENSAASKATAQADDAFICSSS